MLTGMPILLLSAVLQIEARWNVPAEQRLEALRQSAASKGTDALAELLSAIQAADASGGDALGEWVDLLRAWDRAELKKARETIRSLAAEGRRPCTRQGAMAAWILADDAFDGPYLLSRESNARMRDFLQAVPLVDDEILVRPMLDRVRLLMYTLPDTLVDPPGAEKRSPGLTMAVRPPGEATWAAAQARAPVRESVSPAVTVVPAEPGSVVTFAGTLHVPADGEYAFHLTGNGITRFYLNDRIVVLSEDSKEARRTIRLLGGPHTVAVTHVAAKDGGLTLAWQPPGASAPGPIPGHLFRTLDWIPLRESAVYTMRLIPGSDELRFGYFADLLRTREYAQPSILGIHSIDPSKWQPRKAVSVAGEVVAAVAQVAGDQSRQSELKDAIALGAKLDPILPEERRAPFRKALEEAADPSTGALGHRLFLRNCVRCHLPDGNGLADEVPRLEGSPWVKGDPDRLIKIVLFGLVGGIQVGDDHFAGDMRGYKDQLTDAEIAAVAGYVRKRFVKAEEIAPAAVSRVRAAHKSQRGGLNPKDLLREHPF